MKLDLDHIFIKDFFKVLETGDYSFITKNKRKQKKLNLIWDKLLQDYELLAGNKKLSKEIEVNSKIESLHCKFKAINICCDVLGFKYELEALKILKEHYFFIDENNYHKELERVKNESKSILIQIEKLKSQLPKEEDLQEESNPQHIDKIILGYCSFLGLNVKPNHCTVSEYIGLKQLFEDKLKQLEKPVKNV